MKVWHSLDIHPDILLHLEHSFGIQIKIARTPILGSLTPVSGMSGQQHFSQEIISLSVSSTKERVTSAKGELEDSRNPLPGFVPLVLVNNALTFFNCS